MHIPFWQRTKEFFLNRGRWRERLSIFEAVALIVGSTIGAGILGIPFAISKAGIMIGIAYIVGLGLLMAAINLMVGEVASRTLRNLQIVGLSKKYAGKNGGRLMSILFYTQIFSILILYLIAVGEILASLFGWQPWMWTLIFWTVGSFVVYFGIHAVKKAEVILTSFIILVILVIAFLCFPHINNGFYGINNFSYFFIPYGVVLFSFSGIGTIPAAYRLLYGQGSLFKKAIVISSVISITVYILFTVLVIGVTGTETTEIATIGLGEALGDVMFYMANIFAILAMTTSFLMLSMEIKDSLKWDFDFSHNIGSAIALGVPLAVFLAGLRQFIELMSIVGGVLVSLQMFLMIYVYWKAKIEGDIEPKQYRLSFTYAITGIALIAFLVGAASSLYGVIK
ncbi:MAG: aromatic amino acid transport family protein [Patescibacteria group bacterium]